MVYSFLDIQFWLFALLTPLVFFVSFYVPGSFFVEKLKPKSTIIYFLLSLVLGLVMWGVQGFVFGFIQLRWLTYLYLMFFGFLYLQKLSLKKFFWRKLYKECKRSSQAALIFILL